ncbi:Maf family protein [Ferrimonas balearica]|uniref:Maf family protein n=1 Tax=Ferrimonas balearica TaxID=44012 RepID=UPI001F26B89E|nr:Maf family protein [Ferrimonas balearica]MBY6019117.1 Maf-like protein [Halomonas denitrificans]MBY6095721.1 Maf-like protein [Ferrimonas balearica]
MTALYLASSSPRRQQLLSQLGFDFEILTPDIDETPLPNEAPEKLVERLAREKAEAGLALAKAPRPVLGSDTIVVLDGRILGKPRDRADALATLASLSGRRHQVMTAIALALPEGTRSQVITTQVEFCELSEAQIAAYWDSGEPADKAGSYGIQGLGGNFVRAIHGSYSAVVGLPLVETRELIQSL